MKKLLLLVLIVVTPIFAFATIQTVNLTNDVFLTEYYDYVTTGIPDSYQYISIKYRGVSKTSDLYQSLQKAVYANLLSNRAIRLPLTQKVTEQYVYNVINHDFDLDIKSSTPSRVLNVDEFQTILDQLPSIYDNSEYNPALEVLFDVYNKITKMSIYKDNIDSQKALYDATSAVVDSANDPYTVYLNPNEAKDLMDSVEGQYEGIGIYIENTETSGVLVVGVVDNGPAAIAGIQKGDYIIQIGGISTIGQTVEQIVGEIKGEAGTSVNIVANRNGISKNFTVNRQRIEIPIIETSQTNDFYYMKINSFSSQVDDVFAKNVEEMSKYNNLIIDLRDNPGGDLDATVGVLEYFVPKGKLITKIVGPEVNTNYFSEGVDSSRFLGNKNVYVLINSGSASASEVLTMGIDQYVVGTHIIGSKSFGKGTVQELYTYPNNSVLKITVAKRYVGDKNINGIGISPDVKVTDDPVTREDEVLDYIGLIKK